MLRVLYAVSLAIQSGEGHSLWQIYALYSCGRLESDYRPIPKMNANGR